MGLFDRLRRRSETTPAIDIDFSKTLDVVSAYGSLLENGTALVRPMKDLPFSKCSVRSALAFGASGGVVPMDAARDAYAATEGFWPSHAAAPFSELHSRIAERGTGGVGVREMAEYASTIQSVTEGDAERRVEFDLLVKWNRGIFVHLYAAHRRLSRKETGLLRELLKRSVARDGAWFSTVMDALKGQGGAVPVGQVADPEGFVKEVNFVNHDLALIRKLLSEIPNPD
jgi:hypothetical protein